VALSTSKAEHAVSSAGSMANKERLGNGAFKRFMVIATSRTKCIIGFSKNRQKVSDIACSLRLEIQICRMECKALVVSLLVLKRGSRRTPECTYAHEDCEHRATQKVAQKMNLSGIVH
jgi:hypothetical protein